MNAATFIKSPDAVTVAHEGHTAVLRCQTDRPYPRRTWTRGLQGSMFKDQNFQNLTRGIKTTSRVKFIGDLATNDYSIEINNVIKSDEATYKCVVTPEKLDTIGESKNWVVATELRVIPTPPLIVPPPTSEAANSPTTTVQEHHHHQFSPISYHQSSASLESGASDLTSSSSSSNRPPFNNNKAREAFPGARELDRNNQISSSGQFISPSTSAFINNYNGHHHATVRASTAYPSAVGSNSAGGVVSVALVWPYLLLVLAAILMLANVYLIFSLIRRHTRCSKESEANESQGDDSSSMA